MPRLLLHESNAPILTCTSARVLCMYNIIRPGRVWRALFYLCPPFFLKNIFKSEKKLSSGPLLLTTLGFFLDKLMRIFNCQMHVLVNLCIYYVKRLFNCLPISTTYSCLVFHSTCICKHISSLLFFWGGGVALI